MALGYDGSIRIKALLNHNEFDRGIRSMGDSVKSLRGTLLKLAGIVSAAFGVAALVNFGKESVKLASDIEEVQNVIDVTFGKGAAQIEEFSRSAAEAFGLYDEDGKLRIRRGEAKVYVGGHAPDARSEKLTGQKADMLHIVIPNELK